MNTRTVRGLIASLALGVMVGSASAQSLPKAAKGSPGGPPPKYEAPFLYVRGNLGVQWSVDGFGAGEDTRTETLTVLHNQPVLVQLDGFGDLQKTSGSASGAQSLPLWLQLTAVASGATLIDTSLVPANHVNGTFGGRPIAPEETGGTLYLNLTRRVTVPPGAGGGTYQNVGTITISRF
ncbi:MAG: hypothetical protein KIS66_01645 [Fimbriimonadaceae bacterium]|nr:hypothetical protein [Fimbriimonadaceae bacterium]